jgi:hypothetical protein
MALRVLLVLVLVAYHSGLGIQIPLAHLYPLSFSLQPLDRIPDTDA